MSEIENFLKVWTDAVRPTGSPILPYKGSPHTLQYFQSKNRARLSSFPNPNALAIFRHLQGYLDFDIMWLSKLLPRRQMDAAFVYCPFIPLTVSYAIPGSYYRKEIIKKMTGWTLRGVNYWYKYL